MVRYARRWWWVPVVGFVTAALVWTQLADPSGTDEISEARMARLDVLVADRDCTALQDEFDRADDTAELEWLDDAMRRVGCYD